MLWEGSWEPSAQVDGKRCCCVEQDVHQPCRAERIDGAWFTSLQSITQVEKILESSNKQEES